MHSLSKILNIYFNYDLTIQRIGISDKWTNTYRLSFWRWMDCFSLGSELRAQDVLGLASMAAQIPSCSSISDYKQNTISKSLVIAIFMSTVKITVAKIMSIWKKAKYKVPIIALRWSRISVVIISISCWYYHNRQKEHYHVKVFRVTMSAGTKVFTFCFNINRTHHRFNTR